MFTTGGIGPTHDDITADRIAERIRRRPSPPEVMASRMRMARIPERTEMVENATGGPQGFSIGNVYVMAGIPSVMRAMISTVRLEGGTVVQSRSVTPYLGEGQVATELEGIQDRHADVHIGSYPSMDG
ncbi:MAG: molybdopterin-binding protein [Gammaproteobacteria bacterium]|nr:molybdopterin-binding protein [Gammaproteobacteria bacterium]